MGRHASPDETPGTRILAAAGVVVLVLAVVVVVVTMVRPDRLGPSAASPAAGPVWEVPPPASSSEPARAGRAGRPDPSAGGAGEPARDRFARAVERRAARVAKPQPVVPGVVLERLLPTSFRVSSFNVLGHSHTANGGRGGRFASGPTRMGWTIQLLHGHGISVAGLQELQPPQHAVLARRAPGWSVFPGPAMGHKALANAIIWREDTWALVESHTIQIPYFGGRLRPMPYVLLAHRGTGQRVWFANFHNPADARGPAQRWRDAATAREVALANQLTADGTPAIFTGDFNDREEFFCPFTAGTSMHSASGGSRGTPCVPPERMNVDWIFGSPQVRFEGYVATDEGLVGRASDHPLLLADAVVAPTG